MPRRLSYFAIFAVVLCATPPGSAATEHDSTFSVSQDPPAGQFTLYLERDGTRSAIYIEPRADGMVAVTWTDSTVEYLPLFRVQRVEDADGADRTFDVIRRGRHLGTPIPRPVHGPEVWKEYRFRAGSQSECGSFLITDFALLWRTANPTYPYAYSYAYHEEEIFGVIDCGYARNVGSSNSVGGSVFLGGDGVRTHAGLRLRLYSWLAPNVSFDIAPGIVLLADEESLSRFVAPGFSGQVGLTFSGRFGFDAQVFSVKWREYGFESTDNALHVGFRFGAEPGVAGSAIFMLSKAISHGDKHFKPAFP